MASIQKHGKRWRAQMYIKGQLSSRVFDTKSEASQLSLLIEADGEKASAVSTILLRDAAKRLHGLYVNEGKSRSDRSCAKRLQDDPIADRRLVDVTKEDLTAYKDRRMAEVEPASVRRELNVIRGMFRRCRDDWHWMRNNPFAGTGIPRPKDVARQCKRGRA